MKYHFLVVLLNILWKCIQAQTYTDAIRIEIKPEAPPISATQQEILDSSILFFQNLLKMITDESNSITYNTYSCINNADIASVCTGSMPFAEAIVSEQKKRVGRIRFCDLAKDPLINNFTFKKMVDSVIHGIMKIITFGTTQTIKYNFSACGTNQQCSNPTDYPNLKNMFSTYYPTSSLGSMPVVDKTGYVLWDKQYAFEDLMTDNYATENKYWSSLNNQILKDLKWFTVNDAMIQTITIPSSESCLQKNELYCQNTETSLSCNASLTSKSRCNQIDQTSCRAYQAVSQGNCLDSQLNTDLSSIIQSTGTYEYYGWDSRCFLSDIQDISSSKYIQPVRCYKYSCDSSNNVYIYLDTSDKGNKLGVDILTCTPAMKGTQLVHKNEKYYSDTGVTCPSDNVKFCAIKPKECKNFCSLKGVCVQGKCKCIKDYYGDDCSCKGIPQENGVCVSSCSKKMTVDAQNICVLKCKEDEYFDDYNGICAKCTLNCKTCWEKEDKCDSCNSGFVLYPDNTCRLAKDCKTNQYFDGNACADCHPDCKTCISTNTYCTSCISGKYLEDGQCKACPTNCLECSEAQLCTKCKDNTYLSSLKNECLAQCELGSYGYMNTCVQECPKGYYAELSLCQQCNPLCLACSAKDTCTECEYFRLLKNNKCEDVCEAGSVYVRKEQGGDNWEFYCVSCSYQDKCKECLGTPSYCTKCLDSFFLYNTKCLQDCPSQYFADSDLKECIQCNENCLTCSGSSKSCSSCESNLFLKNDTCVSVCGDGYTANTDTKKCDVASKTSDETSSSTSYSTINKFYTLSQILYLILLFLINY